MSKRKGSKAKAAVWAAVALIVVLLAGLMIFRAARGKGADYTEVKATTGSIATYYSFSGSVTPKNTQTLYAKKAMQIEAINVTQGQDVKSGDVLMTTADGQEITAPFDGTVSEIDAEVNAQLMPGAQLCKVEDYTNLQLQVQVDEYDISAVTAGKSATVTINALNKNVTGTVTDVSRDGVYQNGVTYFSATISLPAESGLMAGMSAQATVLNKSVSNTTVLPMSAIQFNSSNRPYVYERSGRKLKNVPVTLGINDGTNVQVTGGVSGGDTILVPPSSGSSSGGLFGGSLRGANGRSSSGASSGTGSSSGGSAVQ